LRALAASQGYGKHCVALRFAKYHFAVHKVLGMRAEQVMMKKLAHITMESDWRDYTISETNLSKPFLFEDL